MKIICLLLAAVSFTAAQQRADRAQLQELVSVSGAQAALDEIFSEATIEKQMRAMFQNVPPAQQAKAERFIVEFSKEFHAEAIAQRAAFMNMIFDIYDRHYTPQDVKELIAFYKTPIGKKLAATGPKAAIESMQTGQKWGQELGQKVGKRVNDRLAAEGEKKPQ